MAQLVEYDLAKVGVAGSSPVSRSIQAKRISEQLIFFAFSLSKHIFYKSPYLLYTEIRQNTNEMEIGSGRNHKTDRLPL